MKHNDIKERTAYNKQFGISGGVGSQKYLCKFESVLPVRTVVSRHLRQAATTLCVILGQCSVESRI